jgi:molybdate-binding protein/DNA-binding XRE family transcriptional regulator
MASADLCNDLRLRRQQAGLSQGALAQRCGLSRQALNAVEAGRQVPSTAAALRLAAALGCRVEDLFRLAAAPGLRAVLVPALAPGAPADPRVFLAPLEDRWVAHPLPPGSPEAAHGLQTGAAEADGTIPVRPLLEPADLERSVLVAGCAPLLGVLARRVGRASRDAQPTWLGANSTRALDLLAAGLVHVAGSHLHDEASGQDNLPAVRARFPGRRMLVVELVRWREGLLVASGNPLGLRGVADLGRPGLRVARREEGAGAAKLLRRLLAATGLAAEALVGPAVADHAQAAQAVAHGAADAAVAIEAVALAHGLGFLPLAEERFDLVLPAERAEDAPVARLLDALASPGFRAEAAAIAGYDLGRTGHARTVAGAA